MALGMSQTCGLMGMERGLGGAWCVGLSEWGDLASESESDGVP